MRRDLAFLNDIVSACRKIDAIAAKTKEEAFLSDESLTAAVLHHLTVIGEAISRLPDDLRAATIDIPQLHQQILHIQTTDFPQSE